MNSLFRECSSLKTLPDVSKWDINNVKAISYMFSGCLSLISLPEISKWNTENISNLNNIFENCSLLSFIPNISKWKFNNQIEINDIFKGCESLLYHPDISKWNAKFSEFPNFTFSNPNSISIKEIKSDFLSEDIIQSSNMLENSSSLRDNNDIKSLEAKNLIINSENENIKDYYYDNFYN